MKTDNNDSLKKKIENIYTDQAEWEDILSVSKEKFIESQMRNQWKESSAYPVDEKIGKNILKRVLQDKEISSKTNFRKILLSTSVAASISILIIIGFAWLKDKNLIMPQQSYVEVYATESKKVQLPDSSVVWMMPNSSIKYSTAFQDDRQVWLEGNSVFEVTKKDPNNTFRVYINEALITVKGTSFMVKQNDELGGEVTLFSGLVDFDLKQSGEKISMNPMQKLVYDAEHKIVLEPLDKSVTWKNGAMIFDKASLAKLIESVNTLYTIEIVLADGVKSMSEEFSGTIRSQETLESVLDKICYTMHLTQQKQNGKIILQNNKR